MADLFGYGHKLFPYLKQMHYDAGHQDLRRNTPAVSCSSLTKQQPKNICTQLTRAVCLHACPAGPDGGFTATHQSQQLTCPDTAGL